MDVAAEIVHVIGKLRPCSHPDNGCSGSRSLAFVFRLFRGTGFDAQIGTLCALGFHILLSNMLDAVVIDSCHLQKLLAMHELGRLCPV